MTNELNTRYDPMTRDELIAECERLRGDLAIQTVNATAVLQAQHERDCAVEKLAELQRAHEPECKHERQSTGTNEDGTTWIYCNVCNKMLFEGVPPSENRNGEHE